MVKEIEADWTRQSVELKLLETRLLNGDVRKDAAKVAWLLADEFCEFGSSGRVFTRTDIIDALQAETDAVLALHEFRAERLGDGAALVTYRSTRSETGSPERAALRSSIWIHRAGRWQMIFHQGTTVPGSLQPAG